MRTEDLILSSLVHNEEYTRKVISHLKEDYFTDNSDRAVYRIINEYFLKYNSIPTPMAVLVEISNSTMNATVVEEATKMVKSFQKVSENTDYLVNTTEDFCKTRAVYNALMESIQIADGKDKKKSASAIPTILQEALAVCFDASVGHDFIDDAKHRYEYYHKVENKVPIGNSFFMKITRKGFSRKTLNVLMAPPHGGKTLMMCNFAVGAMEAGYNVLYITMEMAEEEIARRFDVNMLNVTFDTLETLPKTLFESKFEQLKKKSIGKLKIKQYPTGGGHAGHFRALVDELRMKQEFVPDMIVVDYLNICASEKIKMSGGANSYTIVKSIGEELRALAIQTNTAVVTATQTNREGFGNSDVDITNTSESFGIPAIADFYAAIITSEELIAANQRMIKQLKNRYRDLNIDNKAVVGVDTSKMKLYDLDEKAVGYVAQSLPAKKEVKPFVKKQENKVDDSPPWDEPVFDIKPKSGFSLDGFDFE